MLVKCVGIDERLKEDVIGEGILPTIRSYPVYQYEFEEIVQKDPNKDFQYKRRWSFPDLANAYKLGNLYTIVISKYPEEKKNAPSA